MSERYLRGHSGGMPNIVIWGRPRACECHGGFGAIWGVLPGQTRLYMGLYGRTGAGHVPIVGWGGMQGVRFWGSLKRAKSLFGRCNNSQDYEASGGGFGPIKGAKVPFSAQIRVSWNRYIWVLSTKSGLSAAIAIWG